MISNNTNFGILIPVLVNYKQNGPEHLEGLRLVLWLKLVWQAFIMYFLIVCASVVVWPTLIPTISLLLDAPFYII